jgi:hypothetical protein
MLKPRDRAARASMGGYAHRWGASYKHCAARASTGGYAHRWGASYKRLALLNRDMNVPS